MIKQCHNIYPFWGRRLEAQDGQMLLECIKMQVDGKGFKIEILTLSDTEGGIKSVTMLIEGFNAYGYLN